MVKLKGFRGFGVVAGALGLFAAGFMVPTNAHAQNLRRVSSNFLNFDGSEVDADGALNLPATPVGIFSKTVKVPGSLDTLYVTITATGDGHNGAQTLIQCLVDGVPCNAGTGSNGAPSGFVVVQRHEGVTTDSFGDTIDAEDFHDNNVHYEWCVPIKPGKGKGKLLHTVALSLATSGPDDLTVAGAGDGDVFLEQVHVLVDGSKLGKGNGCTAMANP
jgi:hypothetical protein